MIRVFLSLLTCVEVFAQAPAATVRVEVTSERAPVAGALVQLNGLALHTNSEGVAVGAGGPGAVKIEVSKEGFLPASATQEISTETELVVAIELRPADFR